MDKPPLGLPEGSVRSLITLILLGTVCYLVIARQSVPDKMWDAFFLFAALYGANRLREPTPPKDPRE